MKNASKIYEAHIHTVNLSNDPLINEFKNELFPLMQEMIDIEEMIKHKAALLEADGQLQWEDIQLIFKAAQKASKGGILDKAVGTGKEMLSNAKEKIATVVRQKLSDMIDKYETQAPMKNAAIKINKLKDKALAALQQTPSDSNENTSLLMNQINTVSSYANNNPKVANIAVAILTTIISFARGKEARVAIGMILQAGLTKLKAQLGSNDHKTISHEIPTEVEALQKIYTKAYNNATRLVPAKKRSAVERTIEKMYKYGQSDANKAKKILSIMQNISTANASSDIVNALKAGRDITSTNESLERILWRV